MAKKKKKAKSPRTRVRELMAEVRGLKEQLVAVRDHRDGLFREREQLLREKNDFVRQVDELTLEKQQLETIRGGLQKANTERFTAQERSATEADVLRSQVTRLEDEKRRLKLEMDALTTKCTRTEGQLEGSQKAHQDALERVLDIIERHISS